MPQSLGDAVSEAAADRVLAFAIDFLLTAAIGFVLWVLASAVRIVIQAGLTSATAATDPTAVLQSLALAFLLALVVKAVLWLVITALLVGYFAYLPRGDGQTVGKAVTDVQVVDARGTAATDRQHLERAAILLVPHPLMALLSIFLGVIGITLGMLVVGGWLAVEALLILVDDESRRVGDMVAGTRVIPADADVELPA